MIALMTRRTVSTKAVFDLVKSLHEKVEKEVASKNDLERAKEEILKVVRPIERVVDKDAETIVKHDKRITRIESHLSLK